MMYSCVHVSIKFESYPNCCSKATTRNMPPQKSSSLGDKPWRSVSSICKCRSHCTVFNTLTGLYEGDGKLHARTTRYNHNRDDRILAASKRITNLPSTGSRVSPRLVSDGRAAHSNWITLMRQEVLYLSGIPVTSPNVPLVFSNNPTSNGDYLWPSMTDIVQSNSGRHALRVKSRANSAFLAVENRFCELATIIPTLEQSDEADALVSHLFEELFRLAHEKELQWVHHRAHLTPDKVVVNTGRPSPVISCKS